MVEKTGPYNLLFLFSIGTIKPGRWAAARLTEFKRAYDLNLRVKNMLPDLGTPKIPTSTATCGSQDLAVGSTA
ncbi:hypothetical protein MJ561_05960 [Klebsiella pneumoniae]|nr:hypothetical protein MJ561_05960 [Klebsiella pneumoniae]